MLRAIGALLIMAAGTLSGVYYSSILKQRCDVLQDFTDFLENLKIHLRYSNSDIFTLLKSARTSKYSKKLVDCLLSNKSDNHGFFSVWCGAVKDAYKCLGLKPRDLREITEFGKDLGTTDTNGELAHIDLYIGIIRERLNNAQKELSEKSRLYKTLGFFAGTSIALMIV